jgi:Tol biopolymer transport system component
MTAILNEDPPDISQTTTSIPPALQRVVHRCLEKSPEERFQSASDLAFALEALSVNSGAAPALAWRHGRRLVRLWPVAAFVAVAAVLAYMLFPQPGAITAGHVTQITNDGRIKTAYDTAMVTDGTRLYFNEILSGKLVIGEVSTAGGGTGIVPTTLPSPQLIDISPTGSELLVASGDAFPDNPLWILSLPTGSPRRFGDISAMEASWSPDGRKIAYIQGQSELYVVDADGTGKRKLLSKSDLYTVAFSPDQRRLRLQVTDHQTHRNSFWDVNADGSNLHLVLAEDWNHAAFKCCGRWTPDGRNYVFRSAEKNGSDLWSLPECQRPLFVCRLQPVRLTNGPFWYRGRLAPGKDGGRLFAIGKLRRAELVRYDPRSRQYSPFLSGISAANVDFSLDGQWVTWVGYPDNTLWYSKADGSDARQLTYAPMEVLQGRWAHDANRIAFTAREPGQPARIYIVSREGGAIKPLLIEPHDQYDPAWGPGDSSIAFGHTAFEKSSLPIELFDLKSGKVTALPGSKDLKSPAWSPNGKYLAATSSDSRHFTILNFTTSKWTEATREFSHIENGTFSRDSKYVFFEDQRDSTIYRASVPGAKIQNVASLKDLRRPSLNSRPVWFGIGADNSFLAMRDLGLEEIYALDLQK